jgi:hypothetical protein
MIHLQEYPEYSLESGEFMSSYISRVHDKFVNGPSPHDHAQTRIFMQAREFYKYGCRGENPFYKHLYSNSRYTDEEKKKTICLAVAYDVIAASNCDILDSWLPDIASHNCATVPIVVPSPLNITVAKCDDRLDYNYENGINTNSNCVNTSYGVTFKSIPAA